MTQTHTQYTIHNESITKTTLALGCGAKIEVDPCDLFLNAVANMQPDKGFFQIVEAMVDHLREGGT